MFIGLCSLAVDKIRAATHIIVLMNPNQFGGKNFGFDVKKFGGKEVC